VTPHIEHETFDGIPVHFSRAEGRPLIFLIRMIAWESGIWDTAWAHLAERFTVANFNFFATEAALQMAKPEEGFTSFARHCVDIAERLGYDKFHILGWVGGTQVAMRCAIDHPERVQSCTLLNPHFELPDMRPVQIGNRFKQIIIEKDKELYTYYWVMSGLSNSFVEKNFDVVERIVKQRMDADKFVTSDTKRFVEWSKALRTKSVSDEELAGIRTPTLIVAGDVERWNAGPGPEMARLLHGKMPSAEFKMLEGLGELLLIEAPEKFLSVYDDFLRRRCGERAEA
jgi:pimeloyl-ACP methyl ester carboxylesterase